MRILGGEEKEVDVEGKTVLDVLRALNLPSDEYVVTRGGKILTEDEEVREGDVLVVVPVISGG